MEINNIYPAETESNIFDNIRVAKQLSVAAEMNPSHIHLTEDQYQELKMMCRQIDTRYKGLPQGVEFDVETIYKLHIIREPS